MCWKRCSSPWNPWNCCGRRLAMRPVQVHYCQTQSRHNDAKHGARLLESAAARLKAAANTKSPPLWTSLNTYNCSTFSNSYCTNVSRKKLALLEGSRVYPNRKQTLTPFVHVVSTAWLVALHSVFHDFSGKVALEPPPPGYPRHVRMP